MIGLTKFARRQLVVLVASMVVLSSALDGCLLGCHAHQRDQDVRASAHAHCHAATSQNTGTRWQGDPTCHHDHAAAAESTARNRLDSRELGVLASFVLHPDRPVASIAQVIRSNASRSTPTADFLPLRV